MNRTALCTLPLLAALALLPAPARADVDLAAKTDDLVKSLVIVDFTLRNENSSREDSGQGLVLTKDGVILIAGNLISEAYPKEWITDIKVRVPAKNFEAVPATMLGRTRNRVFAYLKTEKPIDATPFTLAASSEPKLGEQVFSASIMGKGGGYATYLGRSEVRTILDVSHTLVSTASFGLTRGTSPVLDVNNGNFVGLTVPSLGESMVMRDGSGSRRIEIADEDQSSAFFPTKEVAFLFKDIPTQPFDLRRAWLGLDDNTGLQEDVREVKKIDQVAGVMIGTVIPNEAADKAGLKARDIVLTIDGKPFSTNPVPEMMAIHFSRVIDDKKPGDKLTLGILRDGEKKDIDVTLGTAPKIASDMPHTFSPRIGITTRDLIFADAYARRLPQDTKGVMVALVKNGSPSSLGSTPLQAGYLITKLDDQPVENEAQFQEVLKAEEAKPDLKEMVFVVIQRNGETQVCRVDLTK
jgi:S1-C subfamily serine protease